MLKILFLFIFTLFAFGQNAKIPHSKAIASKTLKSRPTDAPKRSDVVLGRKVVNKVLDLSKEGDMPENPTSTKPSADSSPRGASTKSSDLNRGGSRGTTTKPENTIPTTTKRRLATTTTRASPKAAFNSTTVRTTTFSSSASQTVTNLALNKTGTPSTSKDGKKAFNVDNQNSGTFKKLMAKPGDDLLHSDDFFGSTYTDSTASRTNTVVVTTTSSVVFKTTTTAAIDSNRESTEPTPLSPSSTGTNTGTTTTATTATLQPVSAGIPSGTGRTGAGTEPVAAIPNDQSVIVLTNPDNSIPADTGKASVVVQPEIASKVATQGNAPANPIILGQGVDTVANPSQGGGRGGSNNFPVVPAKSGGTDFPILSSTGPDSSSTGPIISPPESPGGNTRNAVPEGSSNRPSGLSSWALGCIIFGSLFLAVAGFMSSKYFPELKGALSKSSKDIETAETAPETTTEFFNIFKQPRNDNENSPLPPLEAISELYFKPVTPICENPVAASGDIPISRKPSFLTGIFSQNLESVYTADMLIANGYAFSRNSDLLESPIEEQNVLEEDRFSLIFPDDVESANSKGPEPLPAPSNTVARNNLVDAALRAANRESASSAASLATTEYNGTTRDSEYTVGTFEFSEGE